MKPLSELRTTLDFYPHELNSSISHFAESEIDWEVFLESYGLTLQRDFVWDRSQKRELIWSILMRRHIPRMAMIFRLDDVYEVIDGKQRLSAMIGFYKGDFSLAYEGKEYYYGDLPDEYRRAVRRYQVPYMVYNEEYEKELTDKQRVDWFRYINFAGTPQDFMHLDKFRNIK